MCIVLFIVDYNNNIEAISLYFILLYMSIWSSVVLLCVLSYTIRTIHICHCCPAYKRHFLSNRPSIRFGQKEFSNVRYSGKFIKGVRSVAEKMVHTFVSFTCLIVR